MKSHSQRAKTIIGWREWCALDALGLPAIAAKIDTGATTSSLHAFKVDYFKRGDQEWVRFFAHPIQRRKQPEIECQAKVVEKRSIVSSNGMAEHRPVIETTLGLGLHRFNTQITLTNRDDMGYRMLIGRKTLAPLFVVDSSLSWTLGDIDEARVYPTASKKKRRK